MSILEHNPQAAEKCYNKIVANFRNADHRTTTHAKLITAMHWKAGGNETLAVTLVNHPLWAYLCNT